MIKSLKHKAQATWLQLQGSGKLTAEMQAARFPKVPKILGKSEKIVKGEKIGILTAVAYLAPSIESGVNMCPWATPECAAACLGHSSGQMIFDSSKNSRIWKTALYRYARELFFELVAYEIKAHVKKALKLGMVPAVRLNGTTDIIDHRALASQFPVVTFYDYTKSFSKAMNSTCGDLPINYHVTFSRSGENDHDCKTILAAGGNVAVVFSTKKGEALPKTWKGFEVIDADDTDARFTDPAGTVAGLRFKGNKADLAGKFIVQTKELVNV